MNTEFKTFDPSTYLDSPEAIASFLADAMETGDTSYISKAIGVAAKAKGMTSLAKATGISREHLYKAFSEDGNPTLKTTLAVMNSLGVQLTATTHQ